jgi:hypothetical protein
MIWSAGVAKTATKAKALNFRRYFDQIPAGGISVRKIAFRRFWR